MARNIKTIEVLCERASRLGEAHINGRYAYGVTGLTTEEVKESYELEEKYKVCYTPNVQELYHWGTLTARIQNGVCIYIYGEGQADANSIETFLNYFEVYRYKLGYKPSNGGLYVVDTMKAVERAENDFKEEYETHTGSDAIRKHFEYIEHYYPRKDILVETHFQERSSNGNQWIDCDVPRKTWIDIKAFEQSFVKERWEDEHRYNYSYHKQGYHHTKTIVHRRDAQGNIVARTLRYFDFEAREKQGKEWNQSKGVA